MGRKWDGMRFKCMKCHGLDLSLYRWQDLPPLGVCHSCGTSIELTNEELDMIVNRRVCDRPECGAEVPVGTGKVVEMKIIGIESKEEEEVVLWDLCDDCSAFFIELMTDPGRIKQLFKSYAMSISHSRATRALKEE